ncbi:hypothetical protein FB45DRAFT_147022 [Roridomyces roridus]|uniref:Uncharacterized protein n=1 Tax=Roridomyces roridus TaxID=1738132 RepID=A0AAD7BG02_9AGAR|nr:hypothetical protein FB45DRAFT_147022 [Roridomyces roridus]
MAQPVLPPELERGIFEICALSRPVLIPKLMLVAWRVKEWLEPLMYRTIVLGRPPIDGYPKFPLTQLLSTIESKPPEFFRDSVQNLHIFVEFESSPASYEEVVVLCSRVQNLWILAADESPLDLPALEPSYLRHLYTARTRLLAQLADRHLLSALTHLDAVESNDASGDAADIELFHSTVLALPRLTHISFSETGYRTIFLRLLQNCPSLKVLFYFDFAGEDLPAADEETLASDPRFVLYRTVYSEDWSVDWQMGVHTGVDYWYRTERFIEKRLSGAIDRRQYTMSQDDWLNCGA